MTGHTLFILVHPKLGEPDVVKCHRLMQRSFIYLCVRYWESHLSHCGMRELSQTEEKLGIILKEKQKEVVLAVLNEKVVSCVLPMICPRVIEQCMPVTQTHLEVWRV